LRGVFYPKKLERMSELRVVDRARPILVERLEDAPDFRGDGCVDLLAHCMHRLLLENAERGENACTLQIRKHSLSVTTVVEICELVEGARSAAAHIERTSQRMDDCADVVSGDYL
jgi:hypothetical protein